VITRVAAGQFEKLLQFSVGLKSLFTIKLTSCKVSLLGFFTFCLSSERFEVSVLCDLTWWHHTHT